MLDLDFVRARFPALQTEWTLFDNAGGSVPLGSVIERVQDYMRSCMVQLGASYALSLEATARVAAGHRAAERLLGAREGEVVIGSSSTVLAKLIAMALRPLWQDGDEVIVTDLDHEANVGAWRALATTGLRIREWRCNADTLRLELEDLEPLLHERTRLVAFTHCSNLIGEIHDAKAVVDRVHAAGAMTCIDGVAFAPHRRVDVAAIGTDLYFASLYKTFGPHLGALFVRRDLLERCHSQNHFFIGSEAGAYKLEPGNVNHELTSALPAVVDYLEALDRHHGGAGTIDGAYARIAAHETALAAPLLAFLAAHPRARLLGSARPDAQRAPTVSFVPSGQPSSAVPPRLDARSVAVRFGHFYAYRFCERFGLLKHDGVVRASMAHYNTPAEVGRLIAALDEVL